jgi:hypothetical protein
VLRPRNGQQQQGGENYIMDTEDDYGDKSEKMTSVRHAA